MKKFYTILIAILLILSYVLVYQTGKEKTLDWAIEEQTKIEEKHINSLQEFTKNYNELYTDFNELYKKYVELKDLSSGYEIYTVTGYSLNDPEQGTTNLVKTGFDLNNTRVQNLPIAASNCIPLYSIVEIKGLGGFIILDTGLGYRTENGWEDENWIDILFDSKEEANRFGVQKREVRIIE